MNLDIIKDVTLHDNNEMSITLTQNVESQYWIKHIDVQYHYIRELVNEKKLIVRWVPSSEILADGMTKELQTKTFRKHQALLGMTINWEEGETIDWEIIN